MKFHESLMFPHLSVTSREDALRQIGDAVIQAGLANDNYVDGLLEREAEYPTGLPVAGGVAIPHTAADFVTGTTIAAATLTEPVQFNEMGGGDDDIVDVSTILMLVIADSTGQVKTLSKLIKLLQSKNLDEELKQADSPAAMRDVLSGHFGD